MTNANFGTEKKKIHLVTMIVIALALFAVAPMCVAHAEESDVVVYDAADFSNMSGRTQQDVMEKYSEATAAGTTYISSVSKSYYTEGNTALLRSPYSAGEVSSDTLEAMRSMSNFYRWLIGVEPLATNTESDLSLQAQALDRNFEFAHHISNDSKPADMDDAIWAQGFECDHNILAIGSTPSGAITAWLNEGYRPSTGQWDTIGHRQAILSAYQGNMNYGYSGSVAVGKYGSSENTFTNAFAAFPAPGYMPSDLIYPYESSWTIQLNTEILVPDFNSDVQVVVKNLTSGESYTCTSENGNLKNQYSILNFVQPADNSGYYYTDRYQVTVTGLTDVVTGKGASLTYTVDFFDLQTLSCSLPMSKYAYTGDEITPVPTVNSGETTLTEGVDYKVTYHNNTDIGTGIVEVTGIGDYCGTVKKAFSIEEDKKDMSQCTIGLSSTYAYYSGEEITPNVTVKSFGNTLTEGTDYKVTYADNVNAGTATVTVTGIGEYSGTATETFSIYKTWQRIDYNISDYEIETGGTATITATAMENAEVTFTSSDESVATIDPDGTIHGVGEGSATIQITAGESGNYYSRSISETINVSKDYHTMVETNVTCADENSNIATVTRKCSVCGKEETESFTTIDDLGWVYFWTGYTGYSYISKNASEGDAHEVTADDTIPSDAQDHTIALATSDPEIMEVDGMTFRFVGTGDVTLTIYAKYRPSVNRKITFNVSHVYDEGVIKKESTCVERGQKVYTCTICGETLTEELPLDPENHDSETKSENMVTETCETEGSYDSVTYCSRCGLELSREHVVVPALGHDWGEWEPATGSPCIMEGQEVRICKNDPSHKEYKDPALFAHNLELTEAKASTCTEPGNTAYYTCSVCHEVFADETGLQAIAIEDTILPLADHEWDSGEVTKEPTTSEVGEMTYTCTVCGETKTEIIPKVSIRTGWQKEDGSWYYYNDDGTKATSTWKKDSKGWCWLQADGRMLTNGWAKDSKGWCWIGASGYMVEKTQWIKVGSDWYHITNGYRDQSKWMKDSKGWCYVGSDGRMVTNGWAKDSKGWCWMGADGYWVSNKWIQSGGQWYYIKSNHYMAANEWAKDSGGWMWMDSSGKITKNKWIKTGGYWYYLKSNGYMATGTQKIGGKTYKFDSAGRWIS